MKALNKPVLAILLAVSLYGSTGCGPFTHVAVGVQYTNPSWAPPYYTGVRYYYFPDIEAYYDLSSRDFVYLDKGQWLFAPALPPVYGSYDLYTGFVIALDVNVFQPWLHHHYYLSHYPRFYYHNVYHDRDIATIRGFNENNRNPILWRQEDRNRINDLRRNERVERRAEPMRPPQRSNYYGRDIGRPVKVKRPMREEKKKNG